MILNEFFNLPQVFEKDMTEGSGNIGNQIKAVYQKIYDQGDDAVEFMYYDSPIFAQYWDEYEGDLDSIIAEVEPSELQIILDELQSAVEDQGLAEGYSLGKVLSLPELLDQIKHILTAKHPGIGWRMTMPAENTFLFSAKNDYNVWSMLVVEAGGDDWVAVGHGMVDPEGKPIIFDRQQLPMTLASASEIADEAIQTYHDIDLSDYADDEDYNQGVAEGIFGSRSNPVLPIVDKIAKVAGGLTPQNVEVGKQIIQANARDITRILSPQAKAGVDVIEAAKWRDPKYKDQLYTQEPPDYNDTREYDRAMFDPKPDDYPGRKELPGGGEYDRTDPLVRGAGIGRSGIKNNILDRGKRKGLPSRDQITSLKQSIRDVHGKHTRANLPEQGVAEGHADQQRKIFKKNGHPVGEVGIDRESSPGVGQWYMKYYPTGDDYSGYDSMEEAVADLKHLVSQFKAEGRGDYVPPKEADYGPEYQAMVRRVGQKAKQQEKAKQQQPKAPVRESRRALLKQIIQS